MTRQNKPLHLFKSFKSNYSKISQFIFITLLVSPSFGYGQVQRITDYYDSLQKINEDVPLTLRFISEDLNLVKNYNQLSQIILVRHGEPALDKIGRRKREEAIKFVKAYDSVGIYPPEFVPLKLSINEINKIYTSTLPRSINTAELVFKQPDLQHSDPIFKEFERKIFSFPNVKLGLKFWLTTSRVLWFIGFNKKDIESFSKAKKRAKKAATFLEEDANKNGKTLLVSHGLLNHYLVKYLKKNGWIEVYDGGRGYLSQKVLVRIGEP